MVLETFEGDAEVDDCDFDEDFGEEVRVGDFGCHVEFEMRVVIEFLVADSKQLSSFDLDNLFLEH